jgi:type III pantothenate kinase
LNRLLVDIGNSRIKWAVARGARIGPMRAVERDQFSRFEHWLGKARGIGSTEAVCVAGAEAEASLQAALLDRNLPEARFARSTTRAAGVTNGYAEPWQLGADRWVAALGAWHKAGGRRAICSVSAGTALTIDVVDARGRHRGGVIAPGPDLMVQTLLGQTHGIAVRAARASRTTSHTRARRPTPALPPLAGNTRDAVWQGSLVAAAALIDRCVGDITTRLRTRPRVFLTGGGAKAIAAQLECRFEPLPDLVLHGLLVLAEHSGDGA